MVNYILCTVIITIINIFCVVLGYILALPREKVKEIKQYFFKNSEEELESAYSPEED